MARLPPVSAFVPTSARGRVLLRVCLFAIVVAQERRSIAKDSHRGVRRVDVRTGAAPSLRQTIVVLGARDAIRWLVRAIPGPGAAPQRPDPELQHELATRASAIPQRSGRTTTRAHARLSRAACGTSECVSARPRPECGGGGRQPRSDSVLGGAPDDRRPDSRYEAGGWWTVAVGASACDTSLDVSTRVGKDRHARTLGELCPALHRRHAAYDTRVALPCRFRWRGCNLLCRGSREAASPCRPQRGTPGTIRRLGRPHPGHCRDSVLALDSGPFRPLGFAPMLAA